MSDAQAKERFKQKFIGRKRPAETPNRAANAPWAQMSADEVARYSFSMRINSYWLEALRAMAADENRSMQFVARRVLFEAVQKYITKCETDALSVTLSELSQDEQSAAQYEQPQASAVK
jgi:hypothetical protein